MMGFMWNRLMIYVTMVVLLATQLPPCTGTYHIGVNYGRNGDNLPSPKDVIRLYQRCGIELIRLLEPNPEVLEALRSTNIQVSLGVRNKDLKQLALSQFVANEWVKTNIVPYKNDVSFGWITLGDKAIPGPDSLYVYGAMNNMYTAITSIGLVSTRVTTVVPMKVLAKFNPPSAGVFSKEAFIAMNDIAKFLMRTNVPLMLNVYPYCAYAADPNHISLEYATFSAKEPVVDGLLKYYSLFDAMADACYAALEKINAGNVTIAIAETGWPSAGKRPYARKENAHTYIANLYFHVLNKGTPRRPDQLMDTFIFEMFNENKQRTGVKRNFGLFYPTMQPVYPVFETC